MRLLANIESFVQVARSQHYGRAARILGVTPSTLSRRITSLEKELETMLIRRSTRNFSLTESGKKLLERSGELVEKAARIKEDLRSDGSGLAGHLRVGAPSDLAITLISPILGEFCRNNEQVSLDIIATQNQPDLIKDRLDAAFVVVHQTKLPNSPFSVRKVGSFARMLFATRRYLRQSGNPETPADLRDHNCIRYFDETAEKSWELHRGKERETVAVNGSCSSTSVVAAAHAAREHLGIAMLAQYLGCHPTYGSGLARVLPEWQGTPAIVLAITADRVSPRKTTELLSVVKAKFATQLAELESASAQAKPSP